MNDASSISDLFELNYRSLTEEFPAFANTVLPKICAAYFTSKGNKIDPEALGNICFLLKDSCAPYSALCGNGLLVSATILANEDRDTESRLEDLSEICRNLGGHRESAEVTASAVFLAEAYSNPLDWRSITTAIRTLKHAAISSYTSLGELDRTVCTAFVLSGDDPDTLLSDAAECKNRLTSIYGEKEDLTYAACVLALCGGTPEEKTEALQSFTSELSKNGITKQISSLPVCISLLCSENSNVLPKLISELTGSMKKKKGFGVFSLPSQKRTALCAFAAQKHASHRAELLALDYLCKTL